MSASAVVDVAIVGAGPAGLAAAEELSAQALTVVVVDENASPGGQIYRGIERPALADRAVLGADYYRGADLLAALNKDGVTLLCGSAVWMIDRPDPDGPFSVGIFRAGRAETISAKAVLIAGGALERPFPIKGWTLPGVMTAGAAQTMLKASGAVPEGRVVLAGTGPLLYLLAAQYARAGVSITALLDTTPRKNLLKALPHLPAFLTSAYFRKGLGLLGEVRRSTKVIKGVSAIEAKGEDCVRAVSFVAAGRQQELNVDTLLLHQGVVPQVNLAMAAGCEHRWNNDRLAFEPVLDESGCSTVPGIFIAGDGAGIGGAVAAELGGRVAAAGIATHLAVADVETRRLKVWRQALSRALRGRQFLDAFYRPADSFRMPDDDVIVCRCEEVTAGAVRGAAACGAQGPNQTKTFLRTGMGPCQGRLCGLTVTELMARELHKAPGEIGHYHIRNPVKPVTLGALASLTGDGAGESGTTRLF